MVGTSMSFGERRARRLASFIAISVFAAAAAAGAQKQYLNIAAGDAAEAMQTLARESGLQVMAPNTDLAGVRTKSVRGNYEPVEALRRMFAGTDIVVAQTGDNAASVTRPPAEVPKPQAKAEVPNLEEVVVTGSRITRAGFDTLQAATVDDHSELDRRGYTNAAQALQSNPLFGISDASTSGSQQAPSGTAQTFVNLFGFGSQRTLTLVNGRRFVSSNSAASGGTAGPGQQVDINLIPVGLIDRIETIAIGGAPVYGADAIAGTVNIILKDNFEGAEVTGQYGGTQHGGGQSYTARALAGHSFADNRANVTFAAEYEKQEGLLLSDRGYGFGNEIPNPANTSPTDGISANLAVADYRFPFMTLGGLPYAPTAAADVVGLDLPGYANPALGITPNGNYIFANGVPQQFTTGGNLVPFNVGTVLANTIHNVPGTVPLASNGGDGFSLASVSQLLSRTDRTLINTLAHYNITEDVRAFFEGSFAHTQGVKLADVTATAAPGVFLGPLLSFSVDNPFLSSSARSILQANGVSTFYLNRELDDIVERRPQRTDLNVYRFVTGFSGAFVLGGQDWKWDVSYNYGRSQNHSSLTFLDQTRLLAAANAVRDSSGSIVCAPPAPAGCVPINLFGVNGFSSEAAAYVSTPASSVSINTQRVATANLGGKLPFGISSERIAFNLGVEHRSEAASFEPDAALQLGDVLLAPGLASYQGISGGYSTKEGYGELEVPIVSADSNVPFIKNVTLEGAARYVDNSLSGPATTWSAGGRFSPRLGGIGDGLTFRGVYTQAIRAPAVTELFTGSAPATEGVIDPCDLGNYNRGTAPAVRAANCTAALAAVGADPTGTFASTTGLRSVTGTNAGDTQLRNEVAHSWSAGFVYQPREIPNFHLAIDWTSIHLTGGIGALGISDLLTACYDSSTYPSTPACSRFRRLTAADIASGNGTGGGLRTVGDIATGFTAGYVNAASLDFAGLITAAEYDFALGTLARRLQDAGSMRLGLKVFYTNKLDELDFPGVPVLRLGGDFTHPRYRAQANVGYSFRHFDTDWQVVYRSSSKYHLNQTFEDTPVNDLPAYALVNAGFGWRFNNAVAVQLGVNNVFDKRPPQSAVINTSTNEFDFIGRSYYLRVTAGLY